MHPLGRIGRLRAIAAAVFGTTAVGAPERFFLWFQGPVRASVYTAAAPQKNIGTSNSLP